MAERLLIDDEISTCLEELGYTGPKSPWTSL